VPIAAALAGLGFRIVATTKTAEVLASAGLPVERISKRLDDSVDENTLYDLIRRGRCDLVVNTPVGGDLRTDEFRFRQLALAARIPCITTISGAAAAVHAIANARTELTVSLQERLASASPRSGLRTAEAPQ